MSIPKVNLLLFLPRKMVYDMILRRLSFRMLMRV